ncbi:MAG: hypothetical protein JNK72_26900 [Myxococcales bacterium]|nr:hypothetical protein [Myxococcales bacterium]
MSLWIGRRRVASLRVNLAARAELCVAPDSYNGPQIQRCNDCTRPRA